MRDEEQDEKHDDQFNADQQHADAHAGLKRNLITGKRLAAETGKGGPRVGECVHANSEPCHATATTDAHYAEHQNDEYLDGIKVLEKPEVEHDNCADERLEDEQEFTLSDEISLAGLVNEFGDLEHRLMDRHVLELVEDHQTKK